MSMRVLPAGFVAPCLPTKALQTPYRLAMLSDEQQTKVADIARLIGGEDERAAYLDMLLHELRGRDVADGELRRIAVQVWRWFLQFGRRM